MRCVPGAVLARVRVIGGIDVEIRQPRNLIKKIRANRVVIDRVVDQVPGEGVELAFKIALPDISCSERTGCRGH